MVSLAEATQVFERTADNVPEAHAFMLHESAHAIATAAHDMIGRDNAAWPPLAESTMEERQRLGFAPDLPLLRTGELRDAIRAEVEATVLGGRAAVGVHDEYVGTGSEADPFRNIGDVAVDQELGTSRIPARPFLTTAGIEQLDAVAHAIVRGVARLLK